MGAAPVSPGLMAAVRRSFPGAAVGNFYGTTEAGPIVFAPHPTGRPTPDLSVGTAHPQVELRLVAADDRVAEEGVLQMRCPALMSGYHNLPEATARAMTVDGIYITGDGFHRDTHAVYFFVGRADDMLVRGSAGVSAGEGAELLERRPLIPPAVIVPNAD